MLSGMVRGHRHERGTSRDNMVSDLGGGTRWECDDGGAHLGEDSFSPLFPPFSLSRLCGGSPLAAGVRPRLCASEGGKEVAR